MGTLLFGPSGSRPACRQLWLHGGFRTGRVVVALTVAHSATGTHGSSGHPVPLGQRRVTGNARCRRNPCPVQTEPSLQASEVPRAVAAAVSIASALDLTVDDTVGLHN